MQRMRQILLLIFAWGAASPAFAANTTATLILSHETARPGDVVWAGLRMRMKPGWHTYWQNGGDAGAPTSITWSLPAGVTAGEILWPVPEKYVDSDLTSYIYHDEVVLLVPLTIADTAATGTLDLKAKADWLECEKACIPGMATVSARLTIGPDASASKDAALIAEWRKKVPESRPASFANAAWAGPANGDLRPVSIEWTIGKETKVADFYPLSDEKFTIKPATERVAIGPDKARLKKEVEKVDAWPGQIRGVLVEKDANDKLLHAYQVELPVDSAATAGTASAATPARPPSTKTTAGVLFLKLAAAFLGGMILNLMPCVLPVIGLKILSFVNQSTGAPGEARRLGLIYGAGVVASLMVFAGIVVGIRAAGGNPSWGMQFQEPRFIVCLTVLVLLVALNFFGVFEVTLGGGAMNAAGGLASREGPAGAFFNGVLAVLLATPCTAPFLGLAVGWAFAQSSLLIVLTFLAIALGLAFPYVVLSFFPQFLRFVPKPGPWMERFKVALGFPVIGTAVWLLTLTVPHYGEEGMLWVGMFLVTVSVAAWVWGQFVQRGTKRKGLAIGIAVGLLVVGYGYALEKEARWRSIQNIGAAAVTTSVPNPGGVAWLPWSPAAVAAARAEGRVVYVDFTAKWCWTCKVNKKTSLQVAAVEEKLKANNVLTLIGDYTKKDPVIRAELERFGRAGVPLNIVYPRDPARAPIVLPELLTPAIVLDALNEAAR